MSIKMLFLTQSSFLFIYYWFIYQLQNVKQQVQVTCSANYSQAQWRVKSNSFALQVLCIVQVQIALKKFSTRNRGDILTKHKTLQYHVIQLYPMCIYLILYFEISYILLQKNSINIPMKRKSLMSPVWLY